MDNRTTELRKLADVIGSNIEEKWDVTTSRTIQLYPCFALLIFPHIFRLVCATFSPSFRHKFPLWWNHPTPSWRPTNGRWEIHPRDISFPSSLTTIVISQSSFSGIVFHSLIALVNCQSPVVQKVNNVIHWIFFLIQWITQLVSLINILLDTNSWFLERQLSLTHTPTQLTKPRAVTTFGNWQ